MESHPIKEIAIVTNVVFAIIPQGCNPPYDIEIGERFNSFISMYIYHNGIKLRVQFTKENLQILINLIGESNGANISTDSE